MKRRSFIAMSAALVLAACGGVKDYADQGPGNMQLALSSVDGGFMTSRKVFVDVWTGPKGPDMEYLGTRKFSKSGDVIGLPTGRPLLLALAFEEAGWLGGNSGTDTIEVPISSIRPGQMWRITVAYDDIGFDWDLERVR